MFERIRQLFKKQESEKEPFLDFPCRECQTKLTIPDYLFPGQAAALNCPNCGRRWVVHIPPARIYASKEFSPTYPQEFEMAAEGVSDG